MDLAALPRILCNHRTPRREPVDLVVVHTNEGPEGPSSAEALAGYLRGIDAGYHVVLDENSAVRTAYDEETVWGAGGVNGRAWHICLTGFAAQSPTEWDDPASRAAVGIAAELVRQAAAKLGVPLDRVTDPRSQRGICGHADVSRYYPASQGHSDPGAGFPWGRFLDLVRNHVPPTPTPEEDPEMGRSIFYPVPGQEAQHVFQVDAAGHLRHLWEPRAGTGGAEDLSEKTGASKTEALKGEPVAYIAPNLDLVVSAACADGAFAVFRWPAKGGPWGVTVQGRKA